MLTSPNRKSSRLLQSSYQFVILNERTAAANDRTFINLLVEDFKIVEERGIARFQLYLEEFLHVIIAGRQLRDFTKLIEEALRDYILEIKEVIYPKTTTVRTKNNNVSEQRTKAIKNKSRHANDSILLMANKIFDFMGDVINERYHQNEDFILLISSCSAFKAQTLSEFFADTTKINLLIKQESLAEEKVYLRLIDERNGLTSVRETVMELLLYFSRRGSITEREIKDYWKNQTEERKALNPKQLAKVLQLITNYRSDILISKDTILNSKSPKTKSSVETEEVPTLNPKDSIPIPKSKSAKTKRHHDTDVETEEVPKSKTAKRDQSGGKQEKPRTLNPKDSIPIPKSKFAKSKRHHDTDQSGGKQEKPRTINPKDSIPIPKSKSAKSKRHHDTDQSGGKQEKPRTINPKDSIPIPKSKSAKSKRRHDTDVETEEVPGEDSSEDDSEASATPLERVLNSASCYVVSMFNEGINVDDVINVGYYVVQCVQNKLKCLNSSINFIEKIQQLEEESVADSEGESVVEQEAEDTEEREPEVLGDQNMPVGESVVEQEAEDTEEREPEVLGDQNMPVGESVVEQDEAAYEESVIEERELAALNTLAQGKISVLDVSVRSKDKNRECSDNFNFLQTVNAEMFC